MSTGLDPEIFRYFAAAMLVTLGAVLVVPAFGNWVTLRLSMLSGKMNIQPGNSPISPSGQFGVGALLGFVWLPCVGPTLGAAVALAALGQNMSMAFVVMLAYGIGTAGVLMAAGMISGKILTRWRSPRYDGQRQARQEDARLVGVSAGPASSNKNRQGPGGAGGGFFAGLDIYALRLTGRPLLSAPPSDLA